MGNSNTVTCTPNAHLTTAEIFSYSSIGGFNILAVDENSKTLSTDHPDYTEEFGESNNDTSGSFNNKFSFLLLIGARLLL